MTQNWKISILANIWIPCLEFFFKHEKLKILLIGIADPNAHIIWIDNAKAKLKALRNIDEGLF